MKNKRLLATSLAVAAGGFTTPWLVPQGWLGDVLLASLGLAIVWGALCANRAKGGTLPTGAGAASWMVLGTDRPGAKITDGRALTLFWLTLLYVAAFCVGAFAAVVA